MKENVKQAYDDGYAHGYDAADEIDNPFMDDERLDEEFNAWQDGFRQFTPFEFRCKEYNESDDCDELWEAYDRGTYDGWNCHIEEMRELVDVFGE